MSSKDNDEEHIMHSNSDNIEIMNNDEEDEIISHLFLDIKLGSDFIFDCFHLECTNAIK